MGPVLLTAPNFCKVVGIEVKRFEMRRQRQRAGSSVSNELLPVSASEPGKRGRFDALDAVRMRAVMKLEAAGLEFSAACDFIRTSGISAFAYYDSSDFFVARWVQPDGEIRQCYGTAVEISRAIPASPVLQMSVNVTAVRDEVATRAREFLHLQILGTSFVDVEP